MVPKSAVPCDADDDYDDNVMAFHSGAVLMILRLTSFSSLLLIFSKCFSML